MDRREAIGFGLAGAAVLVTAAQAQAMVPDGFLPGDSTEFVPLWPAAAPGGEGITLTLKFTDAVQPTAIMSVRSARFSGPVFLSIARRGPMGCRCW